MDKHLVFTFDPNRCIHCKTCEMACNDYYNLSGQHRRKLISYHKEGDHHNPDEPNQENHRPRGLNKVDNTRIDSTWQISIACTHCLNPFCVYTCPENNFRKRRDGIIVLESTNCRLCQKCISACPVGAIRVNPHTERTDKCNFCVQRVSNDLRPVCVENCITGALGIMKITAKELKENIAARSQLPIANYADPAIFILT